MEYNYFTRLRFKEDNELMVYARFALGIFSVF